MTDHASHWEPWQPMIGQRVCVRLSGECNRDWSVNAIANYAERGHPQQLDGARGTVAERPEYVAYFTDHPYYVQFDDPIWNLPGARRNPVVGSVFAALELEPIEQPGSSTERPQHP